MKPTATANPLKVLPHPALRATFPRWGKDTFSLSYLINDTARRRQVRESPELTTTYF